MITVKVRSYDMMAYIPEFNDGQSGAKLSACESMLIHPGEVADVRTGIAFTIPKGYEGQIRNVQSLLIKRVALLGGIQTIDSSNNKEVVLQLVNHSGRTYELKLGTPVAQLVVCSTETVQLERTKV